MGDSLFHLPDESSLPWLFSYWVISKHFWAVPTGNFPGKLSFGKFWNKFGIGSDPPPPWVKFPTFTEIFFWGFPYDIDALKLVYSAHKIVYFESNLTKDCLIWQNFLFWTKFNQNYRFFTRIYPQHYETLLDDRCGYKQLHKLNTVIVQGAPLCIKYNFSSNIFSNVSIRKLALRHDLLLYEPFGFLCCHLAQHLCHLRHAISNIRYISYYTT